MGRLSINWNWNLESLDRQKLAMFDSFVLLKATISPWPPNFSTFFVSPPLFWPFFPRWPTPYSRHSKVDIFKSVRWYDTIWGGGGTSTTNRYLDRNSISRVLRTILRTVLSYLPHPKVRFLFQQLEIQLKLPKILIFGVYACLISFILDGIWLGYSNVLRQKHLCERLYQDCMNRLCD